MPTPAAVSKKRRAKKARARQRARYDLRDRYRQGDVPAASHIGVMTIEDPYSEAGRIDSAGILWPRSSNQYAMPMAAWPKECRHGRRRPDP